MIDTGKHQHILCYVSLYLLINLSAVKITDGDLKQFVTNNDVTSDWNVRRNSKSCSRQSHPTINGIHLHFSRNPSNCNGVVDDESGYDDSSSGGGECGHITRTAEGSEFEMEEGNNLDRDLLNLMEDALYDFDFDEADVDILLEE